MFLCFSYLVIYFLYRTGTIRYKINVHKQDTANLCSVARYNLKARVTRERQGEMREVRAQFGQSIFSFFQQKRKKDILLILIIFAYFKVQKKREKKKMVRKIDHFFIFLILKLNSKIQKILLTTKSDILLFLFSCYC